ncbi:MAG: protein adenylyltransferase SelO family protein [Myxococcota bacterium]
MFSSIDHAGRYAYGNQPRIAQWNLARFAEAIPVARRSGPRACRRPRERRARGLRGRFERAWRGGLAGKLGLVGGTSRRRSRQTKAVSRGRASTRCRVCSRRIASTTRSSSVVLPRRARRRRSPSARSSRSPRPSTPWASGWRAALPSGRGRRQQRAEGMDRINPIYVPRNHRLEEASPSRRRATTLCCMRCSTP